LLQIEDFYRAVSWTWILDETKDQRNTEVPFQPDNFKNKVWGHEDPLYKIIFSCYSV